MSSLSPPSSLDVLPPTTSMSERSSGDDHSSSMSQSGSTPFHASSADGPQPYLAPFADLNLEHIDLSLQRLTDSMLSDISFFVQSHFADRYAEASLRALNLSTNKLTNEAMRYLGPLLHRFPSLVTLDLAFNKLRGKKGILLLGPVLVNHPSLKTLNLSGNRIGASGFTAVSQIFQASRSLERIDLGWRVLEKPPIPKPVPVLAIDYQIPNVAQIECVKADPNPIETV